MASAFGVQLKKADGMAGSSTEKGVTRTPGGARRTDFRTAPVSDLKAMFDKSGEKSDGKTTVSSVQKTTVNKTIQSREISSSEKTSSSRTTEMKTKTEVSTRLSTKDKEAFELLKNKINQCGVENLLKDEPSVAVAKTFGSTGKTYKATVENKLSHNEENVNTVVTKSNAVSVLSFGLTKLRTRPESLKGDDEASPRRNSLEDESNKKPTSLKTVSQGPLSPKLNQAVKDTKYIPGAARGWKTKPDSNSENEVTETKFGKFSDSSVGKVRKDAQEELAMKGFRSVSPVNFVVNSSGESSGSSNVSPRGYKPNSSPAKAKTEELKTDINENIKKFESSKSDSNLLRSGNQSKENKVSIPKTSSGTKISAAEQLALDKDKVKAKRNSGSFSSDSEKGKQSPRVKGDMKWMEKSRISLEEFKQQTKKVNGEGHRPLSRASSSGSNSSFKQDESNAGKSEKGKVNSPRSSAPSLNQNKPKQEQSLGKQELVKKDTRTSKKLGTLKFQDIKKGFETKAVYSRSESPSGERKPQLEIKTKHKFLERKQSFEGGEIFRQKSYESKEVISPRDKGNVLQTIKALTELDAKAKAKPSIVRRTQSLPIEHLGDDSSLDYEDIGDGAYYHDIEGLKVIDDISNEGDISSEADLYEEIPANMAVNIDSVKEFKNKRGAAFKKKKKTSGETENTGEVQTGSEGDIDSDTDSSNSGIYEPIDHDEDEDSVDVASESDSVNQEPPELPPARTQINKKKKDKGDNKKQGLRGKIKKLYKGKSMDSDSALKAVTTSGMTAAPQSVGIIDRLKKKNKSANSLESLNKEDNPVCDSEGTDTDFDQNSPRLAASQGQDLAPPPPPLPPRRASSSDVAKLNNTVEVPSRKSANADNYMNNRVSSSIAESDPPLPPRNRISNKLDLNVVVPVNPGGDKRKSAWPPGKDSYLHGQKINNTSTHSDVPYIDQTPSPKSPPPVPDDAPPLPQRPPPVKRPATASTTSNDSYVDVGDRTSRLSVKSQDSYVDVDAPLPLPDSNYSLADEIRKELDKRPASSGYIKPHDLATVPEPRANPAPFEDVYKFCGPDDDILYMDLSDDQVYGTSANRYKSQFETESLYQFYNKDKISRASKRKAIYSSFDESDEEGYFEDDGERESVYEDLSSYSSGRGSLDMERRPPEEEPKTKHISTLEMFGKKGTVLRALWAEMPEVKQSGVLDTITPHERKLQESMFEIITSEATYLKSLNVLIDVFLRSEEFGAEMSNRCILTKQERHVIFSNIGAIRDTSEKFLAGLESRWKESVILSEKVCDIIREHASKNFECYVHYCSNQTFQDKAVTELRKKPEFVETLRRLESHPDCQGLPMISFLLLPMQRITRLPLLVDAICHRIDPIKDKARHKAATNAFNALSKVVKKCNEGAKKMQQTEQMYHIAKQIDFPASKEIPQIPLISASRYVVKQGEVVKIVNEAASRLPFGKAKPGKQTLHVYLFNDIMLFTKKKGDRYVVTDYGPRNTLHADVIDNPDKHARVLPLGVPGGCKHLFLLVMLENFEKKQVEMVFSCNSLSDRARWVDAVTPVKVTDDQRIYEEWDCPQVQCIKKYIAQEPDELSLEESDVVNVFKKLEDGMYEGERLRDGERGWFPKDHTVEIINSHVRARNLRMKYRLMQASEYS